MGYEYRASKVPTAIIEISAIAKLLPTWASVKNISEKKVEISILPSPKTMIEIHLEPKSIYIVFHSATGQQRREVLNGLETYYMKQLIGKFEEL